MNVMSDFKVYIINILKMKELMLVETYNHLHNFYCFHGSYSIRQQTYRYHAHKIL